MQETVCIGMAFFSAVLTGGWMYYSFHIPLNAVLYAGLFPAAPFLAFGFYRYQGMNLFELGKELLEEKPETIDPKKYGAVGIQKVKELVKNRMMMCGCQNQA